MILALCETHRRKVDRPSFPSAKQFIKMEPAHQYSRWHTCFNKIHSSEVIPQEDTPRNLQKFLGTHTLYFQLWGGGPEGGYFVKYSDDTYETVLGIWEVNRSWGQYFTPKKLPYAIGIEEQGDEVRLVNRKRHRLNQQWQRAINTL